MLTVSWCGRHVVVTSSDSSCLNVSIRRSISAQGAKKCFFSKTTPLALAASHLPAVPPNTGWGKGLVPTGTKSLPGPSCSLGLSSLPASLVSLDGKGKSQAQWRRGVLPLAAHPWRGSQLMALIGDVGLSWCHQRDAHSMWKEKEPT